MVVAGLNVPHRACQLRTRARRRSYLCMAAVEVIVDSPEETECLLLWLGSLHCKYLMGLWTLQETRRYRIALTSPRVYRLRSTDVLCGTQPYARDTRVNRYETQDNWRLGVPNSAAPSNPAPPGFTAVVCMSSHSVSRRTMQLRKYMVFACTVRGPRG
ncbi:hypothetical protein EV401DRAFT_1068734 [Pisolithus croceorrhizus]|nr:hypothetical protein EV401DRAFT_1068734 [Pisolithus croceorrhizus]